MTSTSTLERLSENEIEVLLKRRLLLDENSDGSKLWAAVRRYCAYKLDSSEYEILSEFSQYLLRDEVIEALTAVAVKANARGDEVTAFHFHRKAELLRQCVKWGVAPFFDALMHFNAFPTTPRMHDFHRHRHCPRPPLPRTSAVAAPTGEEKKEDDKVDDVIAQTPTTSAAPVPVPTVDNVGTVLGLYTASEPYTPCPLVTPTATPFAALSSGASLTNSAHHEYYACVCEGSSSERQQSGSDTASRSARLGIDDIPHVVEKFFVAVGPPPGYDEDYYAQLTHEYCEGYTLHDYVYHQIHSSQPQTSSRPSPSPPSSSCSSSSQLSHSRLCGSAHNKMQLQLFLGDSFDDNELLSSVDVSTHNFQPPLTDLQREWLWLLRKYGREPPREMREEESASERLHTANEGVEPLTDALTSEVGVAERERRAKRKLSVLAQNAHQRRALIDEFVHARHEGMKLLLNWLHTMPQATRRDVLAHIKGEVINLVFHFNSVVIATRSDAPHRHTVYVRNNPRSGEVMPNRVTLRTDSAQTHITHTCLGRTLDDYRLYVNLDLICPELLDVDELVANDSQLLFELIIKLALGRENVFTSALEQQSLKRAREEFLALNLYGFAQPQDVVISASSAVSATHVSLSTTSCPQVAPSTTLPPPAASNSSTNIDVTTPRNGADAHAVEPTNTSVPLSVPTAASRLTLHSDALFEWFEQKKAEYFPSISAHIYLEWERENALIARFCHDSKLQKRMMKKRGTLQDFELPYLLFRTRVLQLFVLTLVHKCLAECLPSSSESSDLDDLKEETRKRQHKLVNN
jgi:hypothetical protein